ncbi:C25 family cysteine peptidase [Pontibacter sp. BAB1700]|uniref:putative type IX secretion system sortase PorU2 n=1 Tax=Pontibacter sp. BAB1700 TaxID=1144253 RepID=UPI00026BBD90|nr:C25 family cysteine peptidase [Pontibacter sp. BAB1700]EJF09784.1 hypothetical protein O71_12884 [Pontibacter sp. BAB1700]
MNISRLIKQFLFVCTFVLGLQSVAFAQSPTPYGNEWIDYNKTYYKLKVVNTGLHRLSYGFLDSLGLAGTNPQHFQLFRRGKEVAIYVAGEADGRLDREDFVEFYGERNDGRLDQDLYKNPAHQPHQLYSLYTDTAAYFLTVNPAGGKRMQQVNPSPAGKTPEPYVLRKVTQYFVDRYYDGITYHTVVKAQQAWMDRRGSFSATGSASAKSYNLTSVTNLVMTGPKPVIQFNLIGINGGTQTGLINVVPSSGGARQISSFMFGAYGYQHVNGQIEFTDILPDGRVTFQVVPNTVQKSNVSMSNMRLTFPQRPILTTNSIIFFTDSTRSENPYFEVGAAPVESFAYDVSDPHNPVRIEGNMSGNGKGFVVPTNLKNSHRVLVANSAKAFKPTGKVESLRFREVSPANHDYIIITNKRLMKVAAGTQRPAPLEYASYRASSAGGGYDTLLVNMDQIVNQFHYGEFSSNAIRKFMSYMLTSNRPKHLFIIGKGMKYAHPDYRSIKDAYWTGTHNRYSFYHINGRHPKVHEMDLVPTGMLPASDVFFTFDFRNNSYEPRVPTGRLPATSAENVIAYLNKVKEHEALPEGLAWRKNILQLGGGDRDEVHIYKDFLSAYKPIAEGLFFGGNVIEKYRSDMSTPSNYVNVSAEVNSGVSLITFFGHSSVEVSDLEIGFASENLNGYRNKGKYPVILMNGCYSGDAFIYNRVSFGEDWLLTPDRGAISFMAESYIGGNKPLDAFTTRFYRTTFQDNTFYGRTIGEIHKETISKMYKEYRVGDIDVNIATMTQMVLQGDPAVKIYAPDKPDYAFEDNNASISDGSGGNAIAASNQFVFKINTINLGKALPDSISVGIKRILPDGKELPIVPVRIKPIYFKEQINLEIPNTDTTGAGMNRFEIVLDNTKQVEELNESNNTLQFSAFLPKSGLSILAPMNFAIVNSTNVNLVVQSTQLSSEPKGVHFELDTTSSFNSSIKKTYQASPGAVPSWNVTIPVQNFDTDSTVFFWRARFDSFVPGEDTLWVKSSFRYIKNSEGGWSQSHVDQLLNSEVQNTIIVENKKWDFSPLARNIQIRTVGGDGNFNMPAHGVYIDGISQMDNACGGFKSSKAPRMYFFVLDNHTLNNIVVPGFSPCRYMDNLYQFGDLNNATVRANMQRFIEAIPTNSYVVVVSVHQVPFEQFSPELRNAFKSIGANLISNGEINNGYPYGLIGKKGVESVNIKEITADLSSEIPPRLQDIVLESMIYSKNTQGSITSSIIGPALSWGSLYHNIERYKDGNDSYALNLYGISPDGNRELLNNNVTSKTFDLSSLSADQYPKLQLQAILTDTEDRSAPQLKQWMVYYQAAPEGVIRPDLVEVSEEKVVQQASRGRIELPMAFQNVTPYAFRDSITVETTLTGQGIEPRVSRFKIEALDGNKTAIFDYTMSTSDLDGNYKLTVFVNPNMQPEQQYQNNIYEVNFSVKSKLHPIMDVAFDGVHIMDGELVAPSPLISITMRDENKHVYLESADAMQVTLVDEMNNQKDISIGNNPGEVQVFPASEKNDFRFEYKPKRLENGRYKLVVRGKDVTGKSSGLSPYEINFEVENESKITNFYPYPNPFSTKTQFIFTLTGGVIPDQFKIQIMTVTGKVVKEIMREEIGPIRIGNNKTEYAWDGTDMYGDKLANGVYLYRVVMPKDTEEMKHIWKKGDKGFVNGYGKIYILR